MSYGATQQVLLAGLSTPDDIVAASRNWPDAIQVLHAQIAVHAFQFIRANEAYMKAQKDAMDLATEASQQRIYLHNTIVQWQNALLEWKKATPEAAASTGADSDSDLGQEA